ncbi:hypothetical protein BH11BAC7_BH11BAC7_08960 [soil metagenome]
MKTSKMNVSMMLIVSAIAGATFFFSCSKNEQLTPASPARPNVAMYADPATSCPNVSNPANPYDNAGATHNAGLDNIYSHYAEWAPDPATQEQQFISYSTSFLCDIGYGNGDCGSVEAQIQSSLATYRASTTEDIIHSMGSPMVQDYTRRLMDECTTYQDSTQIDSLLASIKRIESEVIASSINEREKESFLGASSVARYSACYWFQETQKTRSDWGHAPGNPTPAAKYNWTKFWVVLGADIAGYIVGNVPGAIGISGVFATI